MKQHTFYYILFIVLLLLFNKIIYPDVPQKPTMLFNKIFEQKNLKSTFDIIVKDKEPISIKLAFLLSFTINFASLIIGSLVLVVMSAVY